MTVARTSAAFAAVLLAGLSLSTGALAQAQGATGPGMGHGKMMGSNPPTPGTMPCPMMQGMPMMMGMPMIQGMQAIDNPKLAATAEVVRAELKKVIESL